MEKDLNNISKIGKKNKEKKLSKKEERLNKDEQAFLAKVQGTREEWIITLTLLDLLIKNVQNDKDNFVPSIGTQSMSDIDKHAKDLLEKLYNSKEVKAMFADEDRKIEMKPIFTELRKVKPTKWDKEAYFSLNFIEGKVAAIRADEKNKELINKVESIFKWN